MYCTNTDTHKYIDNRQTTKIDLHRNIQIHAHTETHTHTHHMHSDTHICTHRHTSIHTKTYTNTYRYSYWLRNTHRHTHIGKYTERHRHTQTYKRHTCLHMHTHKYIYITHKHIQMTYIDTNAYTHILTQQLYFPLVFSFWKPRVVKKPMRCSTSQDHFTQKEPYRAWACPSCRRTIDWQETVYMAEPSASRGSSNNAPIPKPMGSGLLFPSGQGSESCALLWGKLLDRCVFYYMCGNWE